MWQQRSAGKNGESGDGASENLGISGMKANPSIKTRRAVRDGDIRRKYGKASGDA